mgnify:CR=1 FL=1
MEVVASMETFGRGLHVKLPFDKRAKITKEGISNVVASTIPPALQNYKTLLMVFSLNFRPEMRSYLNLKRPIFCLL